MRFHFCSCSCAGSGACGCPDPSQSTLLDMFAWLRAGLEELGHAVTFGRSPDSAALNLFWEGFTPAAGAALAASGLCYGIIVTEFMDGAGFNKGTPRSASPDRRDEVYRGRWLGFRAAAGCARFFWSMVESNVPALRLLAPASFVELGYSDRLVPASCEEPTVDFSFTGILTPHRQSVLEALEKRAAVVWHGTPIPLGERDRLFRSTRINLSINKTADWEMPSGTRVGLALLCKRGIALDRTPQSTRLSRLVTSRPKGVDFVDFALDMLRGNWREGAEAAFERYRAELPMKAIMERALDESFTSRETPAVPAVALRRWVARLLGRVA
jgi:hypothetical protein